jgi:hypothetical protein
MFSTQWPCERRLGEFLSSGRPEEFLSSGRPGAGWKEQRTRPPIYQDYAVLNDMARVRMGGVKDNLMDNVVQPPEIKMTAEQERATKEAVYRAGLWTQIKDPEEKALAWQGRGQLWIPAPEDPREYRLGGDGVWLGDQSKLVSDRRRNYGQEPDPTKFYHSRQAREQIFLEDRKDSRDPHMRRVTNTRLPAPHPREGGPTHKQSTEILQSFFESYAQQ